MQSSIDLWMTRLAYFFITLPFFLFTALWLNTIAAIFFSTIILAGFLLAVRLIEPAQVIRIKRKTVIWTVVVVCILIFFSGIGTYTYQNDDYLYRNGLIQDLISKDWPVLYQVEGFEGHPLNGKTAMMCYYLGFFLPAALVGKYFGVAAGQFFLFSWAVFGTILVLYHTAKYLKNFSFKVLLMFFAWGTLFFIGALIKYPIDKIGEEGYWLWAGMRLYANSNLGSVYWIFNQTLTAWTITLLIINQINSKNLFFIYSFALFLSPFYFAGLFPFIVYFIIKDNKDGRLIDYIKPYLSFQNIAGALTVVTISYLYFKSNQAAQTFRYLPFPNFKIFSAFMFLSWGAIFMILFPKYHKEPLFWLSIIILIPLPFFQQAGGIDFPGRISMPAYFFLMLMAMELVLNYKRSLSRWAMIVYFIIAGVAHFSFETGQSMYKTAYSNLSFRTNLDEYLIQSDNPKLVEIGEDLKNIKHKDVLTQSKFKGTLLDPKNDIISNYMGDTDGSIFYKYLAKKPKAD